MIKAFEVPENYGYYIAKYNYLYFRRTEALSYLLAQHFEDETDEFCNDDKLRDILNEAIDAKIRETMVIGGVLALITNDEMVMGAKKISTDKFMEKIYVEELM